VAVDVGTLYTASLTLTDSTGAPANPATAVLTVTLPDQTTYVSGAGANPPVTLPPATTGLVTYPYVLPQEGLTKFAWAGTMPGGAPFPPKVDYVNARAYRSAISLADAMDFLGITDMTQAERIRTLAGVATQHAERIVGLLVPRTFTAAWVPGEFRPVLAVPQGPILTTSSVTAVRSVYGNGPSWATADFVVNTRPGTIRLKSLIDFWYGPWTVDYTGGVAVVHSDIEEGIKEILRDLYTPFRGLSVDVAEQAQEGLNVSPFYRIPPRAQMLLDPHELPGFG
jgi:hypothetical protein